MGNREGVRVNNDVGGGSNVMGVTGVERKRTDDVAEKGVRDERDERGKRSGERRRDVRARDDGCESRASEGEVARREPMVRQAGARGKAKKGRCEAVVRVARVMDEMFVREE